MPALAGKDIMLYVNTGDDTTPAWTAVGGQRNLSVEDTNDTIEITNKQSKRKEYLYSFGDGTASLDGVYVPDDASYQMLKDAARNQQMIKVQEWENDTAKEEAQALITKHSFEGPYDGEATYSVDLQITGEWTAVTP